MVTWQVPPEVFDKLMSGFVQQQAHELLRLFRQTHELMRDVRHHSGYKPWAVVLPGDEFGAVLAWLWQTDPRTAMRLLAEYVAQLRYWDELVDHDQPRVRLEDLLRWLPMALPGDFAHTEALIERARADVPNYFADDLNDTSPTRPDPGNVLRLRPSEWQGPRPPSQ